jgi:hypothetical protein
VVEITVPRANHLTIALPPFEVATRKQGVWVQVVEALRGEPELTASYSRILDLLGVRGDAHGAHLVRAALSDLISQSIVRAPKVERVARGRYRLVE